MPDVQAEANEPQGRFLELPNKYRLFVGGYGSGKTWVECQAESRHYWEWPKVNQGYFAPTYSIIRDIYYPTVEEVAFSMGLNVEIKQGNHEVHFYSGRQFRGTTICRSLDHPQSIVGFKIGRASLDEIDTLPILKAEECWRKIIARMRYNVEGLKNGIDIGSTPEGFRFCHKLFVQMVQENPELSKNYGMIQASTFDNEKNLPADYISSLMEIYPKELIQAYLMGQFVNLQSGTVYNCYNRVRCNSTETMQPGEPLFIGCDFNVGKMAATVYVQRSNGFHAVAELKDVFDTPAIAKTISERWRSGDNKGRRIIIYPDATGASRHTADASKSDFAILQQYGFQIKANPTNPMVRDRILAVNKQFEIERLWVNAQACPTVARCLEQQSYDANGDADKQSGYDHQNDASGYPISYECPIIRPMVRMQVAGI